ncbi:ATP-binding cassette domain-containing protein [Cryomorpha ignava]|uniref:ATP-binding cassette domain-containing protein n=1 Tax=Cryomorpha ignava TaxID=101383 RepID=A0A7K3WM57_9FLAO|nr:ABC transporter transmembrane domain-containing protein [Cryomorpha ignava]NEN22730.1 ATP-binding cassette domain-containing protein [Cryomorpha ignava]
MAKEKENDSAKKKPSLKEATRVFKYIKPYSGIFTVGFIFLILSSLTALLFPYFLGQLIGQDTATPTETAESLLKFDSLDTIIIALMIVFTSQAIFSFFRILLFTRVTEYTLRDIRKDAFSKLLMAPLTFYNNNKVGELTSRIATDINQLQTTFTTTIAEFVRQIITIIVGIAALIWLSPKLALIMLSVIPVVAILAVFFGRFIRKISKRTQDAAARSNGILEEALQGIQNVKAFTNEFFELARYKVVVDEIKSLAIKGAVWRGLFVSFIILCMFGSIVFVIWQGVLLTQDGGLPQSSFIAFIMYTIFLGASIGSLPDLYANIQKAIGATENLMEIIEQDDEGTKEALSHSKKHFRGDIAFKNVAFTYETRSDVPVLKDISFNINSGEQLAIVGPSGAGKSTITSLLLRFYNPVSGEILIDGKDAASYDLTEYRSQFALVPQEVLLFNGTIKENIAYGRPGASDDEIIEAAKKANAFVFITSFPEEFETLVGERGVQLSGGQRQRIAIARAVLRDPAILILDEATSSLDSESEQLVQQALEDLMKGRTSVVIAHRFSTIRNADKIVVLEDGKIIESGNHEELLALDAGLYRKLQRMQSVEA